MSILDVEIPEGKIAYTLSCDIKIAVEPHSEKPLITDCGFLRHNQAAKELYGCSLDYRYKSQFRSKDATLTAQCRMVASQRGQKDYNSSSLNYLLRADGEGVWVRQDVATYHEDNITYWLAALSPSSQPGYVETCNINDYDLTLDDIQAVCGRYTIADIQAFPANLTSAVTLAHNIPENVQASNVEGQSSLRLTQRCARWPIRFLHCCRVCGWIWSSVRKKPKQCAQRTSCASEIWWRK